MSIIGKIFNRLLVQSEYHLPNKDGHRIKWCSCLCSCGKTKELRRSEVVSGNTKSCGCLSTELQNGYKPIARGEVFHHLTFLEEFSKEVGKTKKRQRLFARCLCSCGNETTTQKKNLLTGATKSCGCLQRQRASEANKGKRSLPAGEANFRRLLHSYKKSALLRKYTFDLPDNLFRSLTSSPCFYCGTPPTSSKQASKSYGTYCYNGIDRVDNKLGYSESNCVPCCKYCNMLKGQLSKEAFLAQVSRIQSHQRCTSASI